MEDWKCLSWSFESLIQQVGENVVHVRSNTSSSEYRVGKKYNIQQMSFKDYAEGLIGSSKKAKNLYLAVQNVKQTFPQLQDELPIPTYIERAKIHRGPFLWMGSERSFE
jgi:hypothetical protein